MGEDDLVFPGELGDHLDGGRRFDGDTRQRWGTPVCASLASTIYVTPLVLA
jgi:hypothetical protein